MSSFNINNAIMGINIVPSGTNETISISSDNKVGIGISSPVYQLDVVGTGNFSNDLISTKISVTDTITQKINNRICDGRLTLESGVAISITDQIDKDTIFFTTYNGNAIGLYDGSVWELLHFDETSLSIGTLTNNTNYDIFAYNNNGTLALEIGPAWTDNIARSTGLTKQDGVYIKSGDTTRRYLGTFRTTSTTTTEDSRSRRLLWNCYNQILRSAYSEDNTSHTYTSATYRPWNNSASFGSSQSDYVVGLSDAADITFIILGGWAGGATTGNRFVAFSVDQTSGWSPYDGNYGTLFSNLPNAIRTSTEFVTNQIGIGYHIITTIQSGSTSSTFQQSKTTVKLYN
jgi:hypothetical protein